MIIGGLEKLTLIDFPGHVAAIIFTDACNFRCQFCYNPALVIKEKSTEASDMALGKNPGRFSDQSQEEIHVPNLENGLFNFLNKRFGKLDGIVITGGEPTMHSDLPEFILAIKKIGYDVKLDTNGTNSKMLEVLIKKKLIDYIAMDLKAPLEKYDATTGVKNSGKNIKSTIALIKKSGLPYEFRTTIVPGLHSEVDIAPMGKLIKGAEKWYLQKFKSDTDLVNKEYKGKKSFSDKDMNRLVEIAKDYVKFCEWR